MGILLLRDLPMLLLFLPSPLLLLTLAMLLLFLPSLLLSLMLAMLLLLPTMDTLLVMDTLDPSTRTLTWLPILMELWSLLTNLLWLLPVLITLLLRDLLTLLLDLLLLLPSPTVECTLMPSLLSTELVMDTLPTLVLWLIPTELWSLWTSLLYRQLELITSLSLDPPSTREREREN